MKRATSAERETPKKRRRSRGPCTTSPSSRQRSFKSLSIGEAKASSELFQKAIKSRKMDTLKGPVPTAHAALEPAAELLETPPASSPPENLESVVQRLPPSSGSADMDLSDGEAPEELTTSRDALPDGTRDNEERQEDGDNESLMTTDESRVEEKSSKKKDQTETMQLEILAPKTPEPKMCPDEPKSEHVEAIATPHQGSGASADDAMELDPSPSAQLEHELQLSQQAAISQAASSQAASSEDTLEEIGSVVTSAWLLPKLLDLTPDTLTSGRAAIIEELRSMKADIEKCPRAEMHSKFAGNPAAQRLLMVEKLIAPQLEKLSGRTWRVYKSKLLLLCGSPAIHNMDHWQRLEKVKEIVYMPEEMELLRSGDAERIACAVRVCATVTEILGRDDEIVPEEMEEWVAMQLKDTAWKLKAASAWRKYWPDTKDMAVA
ncbi:hypothetical protein LLEC1_03876 [Akanthomyces lecanii]|uniref:Uncharacterized protein n=1 Tax=Cordyceps confragosa TaxID=2714763 RepID=A0A179I4M1_CORDF|nr:hypothetical protein LLEC1_03876 [Akanthomyces lecanii]